MKIKPAPFVLCLLGLLLLCGCDSFSKDSSHRTSSLSAYLYPDHSKHIDTETIPVLSLPLRVGIAFVPFNVAGRTAFGQDPNLSGVDKLKLMKEIGDAFKSYPFVKSIDLIPTEYLTPEGSFANLDQIKTMYGIDVMVLLSYDQAQFTDEGITSLTYWTIVGAYLVPGEKNETKTMLDAAVYDIASRKLLFRAPGLGEVKASSTLVNLSEELRANSDLSFREAETNTVANLKVQLAEFRERVKESPADFKVIAKPGYTGGAAFGAWEGLAISILGIGYLWMRRNQTA